MLIDWITARVPLQLLTPEAREAALNLGDRVVCYCPKTGDVRYEGHKWESIRSDSHQLVAKAGSDLWIQGSPARVIGNGCAVFGAGASANLDIIGCTNRMVAYLASRLGVTLPNVHNWKVTRTDVTGNLDLGSLENVRAGLAILRSCEGGRYRTSQQAGDTVYWSHRSKLRSGKAYAKGPHLAYLKKQKSYDGVMYTNEQIAAAGSLLRLELKLGREYFARNPWQYCSPAKLKAEWESYFMRMIGGADMKTETDLKQRVLAAADSEGRGKAAYGCWVMIQNEGWEAAREFYSKTTWYRHLKILKTAGLGDADISSGQVVPLRRKIIEAGIVTNWSQIAA